MNLKKLLMIAATSAVVSNSVYADNPHREGDFYIKVNAGINRMHKSKAFGFKTKTRTVPAALVGVGMYVMDNIRTDLTFELLMNPKFKGSTTENVQFIIVPATSTTSAIKRSLPGTVNGVIKTTGGALMLNGYIDVFDIEAIKGGVFFGAGIGLSQIKEKLTTTATPQNPAAAPAFSFSGSTKKRTNFAYHLTAGLTAEVAPGVNAEIAYKWQDLGKAGKYKGDFTGDKGQIRYKGHNLIAGVRFDL